MVPSLTRSHNISSQIVVVRMKRCSRLKRSTERKENEQKKKTRTKNLTHTERHQHIISHISQSRLCASERRARSFYRHFWSILRREDYIRHHHQTGLCVRLKNTMCSPPRHFHEGGHKACAAVVDCVIDVYTLRRPRCPRTGDHERPTPRNRIHR